MQKPTIGVIGAQGSFGTHLCRRLAALGTYKVLTTENKEHSVEIAAKSDIVVITVRPAQVDPLLAELKDSLKSDALVVSFAALYPLDQISNSVQRHAARVMADPDGWASVYLADDGFPKEKLVELLGAIHARPPVEMRGDDEVDRYSALLSYLLVVLLLTREKRLSGASRHLKYMSDEFKSLGCNFSEEDLRAYPLEQGALLKKFATPGGITEKVSMLVQENAVPQTIVEDTLRFIEEKRAEL